MPTYDLLTFALCSGLRLAAGDSSAEDTAVWDGKSGAVCARVSVCVWVRGAVVQASHYLVVYAHAHRIIMC